MRMLSTLRHSCRSLLQKPVFSGAVALTLALGMGANCAVLIMANAVLLRPLPYADSDRVVQVWSFTPEHPEALGTVSFPDFHDWEARSKSFSAMTAYNIATADLMRPTTAEELAGASVTVNFFEVLGMQPALGRTFRPEEKDAPVVVLAYSLWKRDFGGRTSVLGERATLSGKPYTIIGVMPQTFTHPEPLWSRAAEFWRPIQGFDRMGRGARFLRVLGRLKAGVDVDGASSEMNVIGAQLAAEFPKTDAGKRVRVVSLRKEMFGELYRPLFLLLSVSLAVLLVACANVANLQFVRVSTRVREVSMRVALGAKLRDLMSWFLGESLVLALVGGAGGLFLGYIVVSVLRKVAPVTIRGLDLAVVDVRTIGFALGLALFAALIIGLPPLMRILQLQAGSNPLQPNLHLGSSRSKRRTQSIVIGAQLAAVLPLLIATLVLSRSLFKLLDVDPGFSTGRLLSLRFDLPQARYSDTVQMHAFLERFANRAASVPGVHSVALTSSVPLTAPNTDFVVPVSVKRGESAGTAPAVYFRVVSSNYFDTLGISRLEGDIFSASDEESNARVAVINARFAQEYLPHDNPVGKEVFVFLDAAPAVFRVIGMVQDARSVSLSKPAEPEIYVPYGRDTFLDMAMVVRTELSSRQIEGSIRSALAEIDKEVAPRDMETIEEIVRSCTSNARFATLLVSISSVLAFALSLIGVAGVVAYIISDRTKDFAIRLALGATYAEIMRNVVGRMLGLTACGILIGLPLATFVTRIPSDLIFGIRPLDLFSFGISALILAIGVGLASYLSASRIVAIDPARSLRVE